MKVEEISEDSELNPPPKKKLYLPQGESSALKASKLVLGAPMRSPPEDNKEWGFSSGLGLRTQGYSGLPVPHQTAAG